MRDAIETGLGFIALGLLLSVPYTVGSVILLGMPWEGYTVAQQVFVWLVITALAIATISGAFLLWVLGCVFILVYILAVVFSMLG